jgi:multidrug efflux pump
LVRLRPIVMTTVATVLGALPLVVATGAGAASRAQIGMVIVAGMLFGTMISLFVVPVVYSLLSRSIRRPMPMPPDRPT